MDDAKQEVELVEGAAVAAGTAAEHEVEIVWDERQAFIDAGHKLITEGLADAKRAATHAPSGTLGVAIASIEQTLRAFFNHLTGHGVQAAFTESTPDSAVLQAEVVAARDEAAKATE